MPAKARNGSRLQVRVATNKAGTTGDSRRVLAMNSRLTARLLSAPNLPTLRTLEHRDRVGDRLVFDQIEIWVEQRVQSF